MAPIRGLMFRTLVVRFVLMGVLVLFGVAAAPALITITPR